MLPTSMSSCGNKCSGATTAATITAGGTTYYLDDERCVSIQWLVALNRAYAEPYADTYDMTLMTLTNLDSGMVTNIGNILN